MSPPPAGAGAILASTAADSPLNDEENPIGMAVDKANQAKQSLPSKKRKMLIDGYDDGGDDDSDAPHADVTRM